MTDPIPTRSSRTVEASRVHRRAYVDPGIFALELEHIFETTWIYVGHDSQIADAGDYYATTIGRQPVVMVRQEDGTIAVFYNRCPHKGTQLVPEGHGQLRYFRCGYHGWIFALDGSLRTRPLPGGYADPPAPGAAACQTHMSAVAASGSYRGFVFARLGLDGPSLEGWLGDVASSIDNMVDRAPAGRLEVTGGVLRYVHDCNWKFFVENLNDLMHPMVAHLSSVSAAKKVALSQGGPETRPAPALEILSPFANSYGFFESMGLTVFDNGHSYSGGTTSIHGAYSGIADYDAAMVAAYGEARANEIFSINRHNTVIYPSLTLKGPIQTIRVVKPLAVDKTLIESWTLRLVGAPESLLERSILYCNLINSSANLVGPDDHEAYRRQQQGLQIKEQPFVDMSRHFGAEKPGEAGGMQAPGTSDIAFRNQFRAWAALMPEHAL